jgi:hypothetical protein
MRFGLLLLAVLFIPVGCVSGKRRVRVYGDVSYRGKVVDAGEIAFIPVEPTQGPSAGSKIESGHFEIPEKNGLQAGGTYTVEIRGFRKSPRKVRDPLNPSSTALEVQENYIPREFNVRSQLSGTISEKESEQRMDFALP